MTQRRTSQSRGRRSWPHDPGASAAADEGPFGRVSEALVKTRSDPTVLLRRLSPSVARSFIRVNRARSEEIRRAGLEVAPRMLTELLPSQLSMTLA